MNEEKDLTIIEIRIKLLRDLKGLTQNELAKSLNVSRSLINSIENGYINIPLKLLVKLSYFYQVPIDYILGLVTKFNKDNYQFKENVDLKYLGGQIKIIRKIENLNQQNFANRLNINRSSISYYEKGKSCISTVQLKDICNIYGYSADWCIGTTSKCIRRNKKVSLSLEEAKEIISI